MTSASLCLVERFASERFDAPDGTHRGTVSLPELCASICFGGPKSGRLSITAQTSRYAVLLATTGATWPAISQP
jgi:sugar lactone lactonase YvrE